jgi:dTDP-4-amino-4,6-dideoxygalactose transaminase
MQIANIRLSKSTVGELEARAVAEVIADGRLGMGTFVEQFESGLAGFVGGNRQVVCVNTGTAALHLALQACGIGAGDEVLVPTLTYLASFQAISASGATAVACDVNLVNCCLDPDDAAKRITVRTKAIMPVHYASGQGDLEGVYALAQKHGLRVVEDAAHAFGCTWGDKRIGVAGDIVCFSFDGIKNITSGEGGAVVTSDPEVAGRVRDARLLGVEKDTEKRYAGQRSWEFDVRLQGWRYHMSNLFAAIGRVQLRSFPEEFAPQRIHLARHYESCFRGIDQIRTLGLNYGHIVPHIFPVLIDPTKRDEVREALKREGIETGVHYKPNHLLSYYGGGAVRLPVAEELYTRLLTLPLHVDLTDADQDRVVQTVREAVGPTTRSLQPAYA